MDYLSAVDTTTGATLWNSPLMTCTGGGTADHLLGQRDAVRRGDRRWREPRGPDRRGSRQLHLRIRPAAEQLSSAAARSEGPAAAAQAAAAGVCGGPARGRASRSSKRHASDRRGRPGRAMLSSARRLGLGQAPRLALGAWCSRSVLSAGTRAVVRLPSRPALGRVGDTRPAHATCSVGAATYPPA